MEKVFEFSKHGGSLSIYNAKNLLLLKPKGIINPSIIKEDLNFAREFGTSFSKDWIYLVNTEKVLFPNPLNIFYLSKIKHLPNIKAYVIYAPSKVVQILGKLTELIIKPDMVLKSKAEYEAYLASYL
jgi:hypothetical protein